MEEERQKRLRETHGEPVLSEPKDKSKVTKEVKVESPKQEKVQKEEVGFQVLGWDEVDVQGSFRISKVMIVL